MTKNIQLQNSVAEYYYILGLESNLFVSREKIAFIKSGKYSGVNRLVESFLLDAFPNHPLDVIDTDLLINPLHPINVWHCFQEYGNQIKLSKDAFFYYIIRTSYYVQNIRKIIQKKLYQNKYFFSFQTQSLFSVSIPDVPHFIYTDHCHLAPLQNRIITKYDFLPDWWIAQEKEMYLKATQVFTMSPNIDLALIELYQCPPEKVSCVYAGSLLRKSGLHYHINQQKYQHKTILFVGTQWNQKGGPILYKAFQQVVERIPDAQLIIVGAKPKISHPNVHVIGKIPTGRMRYWLNQVSVFCVPSQREPFSISYLDALAYQLPIVMSHSGVKPIFVKEGKNGYALKNGDISALADKLIYLLNNPELCHRMGRESYNIHLQTFNWDNVEFIFTEKLKATLKQIY